MIVAGVIALILAHAHRPPPSVDLRKRFGGAHVLGLLNLYGPAPGWSHTAYDAVHVGGAVLLLAGALLMIAVLVALARRA